MNEAELNIIEARANAATPGEWEAPLKDLGAVPSFAAVDFYFDHSFEAYPPLGESGPVFVASSKEDADFIAHARTDIPALILEIRRLRNLLAARPVTRLPVSGFTIGDLLEHFNLSSASAARRLYDFIIEEISAVKASLSDDKLVQWLQTMPEETKILAVLMYRRQALRHQKEFEAVMQKEWDKARQADDDVVDLSPNAGTFAHAELSVTSAETFQTSLFAPKGNDHG
jgi:hypothetical protein